MVDLLIYPGNFEPPGPATQADEVLSLMEEWLEEYRVEYENLSEAGMTPEQWVKFRAHYANIHWMYMKLVEKEDQEGDS